MRKICPALALMTLTLAGAGVPAWADPIHRVPAPLVVKAGRSCALGYTPDGSGRCTSNSFGFGVSAYPLGYSIGPFANFAPIYGRPFSVTAQDGISQYVIAR